MKRALIFGAAQVTDWSFLKPYLQPHDLVICADGGRTWAEALGLAVDWYVGDSDSGGHFGGCPADLLPSEKDVTDLDMAVSRALREGARELILCGCTGGREDHHLSAIGQLERIHRCGSVGIIVDPCNEIRILPPGCTQLPLNPQYHYFGVVPLDPVLKGVTIKGAKYEVTNTDFYRWESLGISNEPLCGIPCSIEVTDGIGLLVRSN